MIISAPQDGTEQPLCAKQVEPDKLVWAIVALAEDLSIRAVAQVFAVDPNTVLNWLVEAADHTALEDQYGVCQRLNLALRQHIAAIGRVKWFALIGPAPYSYRQER